MKKLILIVAICLGMVSVVNAEIAMTFAIKSVEKNHLCQKASDDPEAVYMIQMEAFGSGEWSDDLRAIRYDEIKYLMEYFDVNTPEGLSEKVFNSQRRSSTSAVNYLITVVKNGGNYTPPSSDELYEAAALSLSKMEEPDFSKVDDETIYLAFAKVWEDTRANKEWLDGFKKRINQLSGGKVQLADGDQKTLSNVVRGPGEYLVLKKGVENKVVVIGPYSRPVKLY